MRMHGFFVIVRTKRNSVSVTGTERIIIPIVDDRLGAIVIAAAVGIAGGGDITEASCINETIQVASALIAGEQRGSSKASNNQNQPPMLQIQIIIYPLCSEQN